MLSQDSLTISRPFLALPMLEAAPSSTSFLLPSDPQSEHTGIGERGGGRDERKERMKKQVSAIVQKMVMLSSVRLLIVMSGRMRRDLGA